MTFWTGQMRKSLSSTSPALRISITQPWPCAHRVTEMQVLSVMGTVCQLLTGVMIRRRNIVQTLGCGKLTPDFVQIKPFGKIKAATWLWHMVNFILEWGARALLSIATIPRFLINMCCITQPAGTTQTEYSRLGSPAQTCQSTFAWRAVTHRGQDAQPAQTLLTSDVLKLINAFIPV